MARSQPWIPLYAFLSCQPVDHVVTWADASAACDTDLKVSRGALMRAKRQLEERDGKTVTGQSAVGFEIRRVA